MKTPAARRAIDSSAVRPGAQRNPSTREQLPLRNLPDCLLAAYDEVSHRAFSRFVARGSSGGNELADWRAAEKDLFLPVAGCSETRIEVAIEDGWLLIWGHPDPEHDCEDEGTPSRDRESPGQHLKW